VLTPTEKKLALDLVAMSEQTQRKQPSSRARKHDFVDNRKQQPKLQPKLKSNINLSSNPINRAAEQNILLEIKKRTAKNRFSKIGAVPVLSLGDEKVPFLQEFVKNILRERNATNDVLLSEKDSTKKDETGALSDKSSE